MKFLLTTVGVVLGLACWVSAENGDGPVIWTRNGAPTEAQIESGPWTLEQSGAAVGLKSAGYCDSSGTQVGNHEIERMQPYYFPFVVGKGKHLQGYFDWRPKDIDEGVVAAVSEDAGFTWAFQQKVLELRKTGPTTPNADPDGDKDFVSPDNSDNVDDDGQGHQFVMHVAGHSYLYTLIRATGYIDSANLVIHDLTPEPGKPLHGAPDLTDAPTDQTAGAPRAGIPYSWITKSGWHFRGRSGDFAADDHLRAKDSEGRSQVPRVPEVRDLLAKFLRPKWGAFSEQRHHLLALSEHHRWRELHRPWTSSGIK